MREPRSPKARKILAAAREIFFRVGYERTSMDAIVREAKTSKTTLYAHFPSKECLLSAIIDAECLHHARLLTFVDTGYDRLRGVLTAVGTSYGNFFLRQDVIEAYWLVIEASRSVPDITDRLYRAGPAQVHEFLTTMLDRAVSGGEIEIPDSRQTAERFLSMISGLANLRSVPSGSTLGNDCRVRDAVAASVDMFLAAYGRGAGRTNSRSQCCN